MAGDSGNEMATFSTTTRGTVRRGTSGTGTVRERNSVNARASRPDHHSGICRTSISFTFTTSPKRIAQSIAAAFDGSSTMA